MFSLWNKVREGEIKADRTDRSDRFCQDNGLWYFKTREGLDVGPFESRGEAQYALLYFTECSEWPDAEQLKSFIEGCEYHVADLDKLELTAS